MLYAAGYKFSLGSSNFFQIQKTGTLILDTQPEGAKIYLNNEPKKFFIKNFFSDDEKRNIVTPAKIKNLLPGEYAVTLKLNGYQDWNKKLIVKEGEATYAEDVFLFKNSLPVQVLSGEINDLSISPNKKFAAASNEKTSVVNLENEEILSFDNGDKNSPVLWSPDSKKIINGNYFHDINTGKTSDLQELTEENAHNFKWDGDNQISYLIKEGDFTAIKSADLSASAKKTLFISKQGEEIMDYALKNGATHIIKNHNNASALDIHNQANLIASIELSNSNEYEFLSTENNLLALLNKNQEKIYLINTTPDFRIEEILDAKKIFWINENKYLAANNFEIWINDLKAKNKTLLTRISSPIENVLWHPSNNYVIFSTKNAISAIELDTREKRNITELARLDEIKNLMINKKGDIIYFQAKIGNQKGLYKLEIN